MRNIYAVAVAATLCATSYAVPVKLPAGMSVDLELQHHVNSSYVPAGSPIYFRVAKDVVIDGQVLVRAGTLAIGKMEQASGRGMVGRSGSMMLDVHTVKAVDGTVVPIAADLSKKGRSRAGATVAWTLFWGLPGLVTHGVNPYLERGAVIAGEVTAETAIDPANASTSPEGALPEPAALRIDLSSKALDGKKPLKFYIEKQKTIDPVIFDVAASPPLVGGAKTLESLQLISVDGVAVPIETLARSATDKTVTFDGWSLVRFCRNGATELRFRGTTSDGKPFESRYQMRVQVEKKD
jgi:hypothetical protein